MMRLIQTLALVLPLSVSAQVVKLDEFPLLLALCFTILLVNILHPPTVGTVTNEHRK